MIKKNKLEYIKYFEAIFVLTIFFFFNYSRFIYDTFNLEWYFVELSQYFFDKNYYFDIHLFKQNQANTTFYSLLASVLNNFLISYKEKLIFFRILNILFFFILLYFFYKTIKISLEEKSQILSLILFCPIITIYAFRIYPDFISICISWLSIIFLINEKKKISILLYCLSFMLKPVAIVIFPFLIFVIFKKFNYKKKFENYLLIFYYIFFLLVTYILYFFLFEQIIFNEYYKTTYYNFNFYNTFLNFFYYYNYSILLIFPFIIYLLIFFFKKKKISISEILYITIIALLSSSFLKFHLFNNGEMNYGYINKLLINNYIVYFLIFTNTFLGIFLFYIFYKEKKIKIVFLVFFICLLFLSILIARPAQRYLVYFMPLLFFLIIEIYRIKKIKHFKLLIIFYIFFFSGITYGQKKYQETIMNSEKKIIDFILERNLNDLTSPGEIYHSRGNLFKKFLINEIKLKNQILYTYKIDGCDNNINIILKEEVYLLNFKIKEMCLTKIN
jgi:hypothetical protein